MLKNYYPAKVSAKSKKGLSQYLPQEEDVVLITGVSINYLREKFLIYYFFSLIILLSIALAGYFFYHLNYYLVVSLAFILAAIPGFIKTFFLKASIKYILTEKRVIVKKGYFDISVHSTPYNQITHIRVDHKFIERVVLDYGKITINTAGINTKEIVLEYVTRPLEFKNIMEKLIQKTHVRNDKSNQFKLHKLKI